MSMRAVWSDGEILKDKVEGLFLDFEDHVEKYCSGKPSLTSTLVQCRRRRDELAAGNPVDQEEDQSTTTNPVVREEDQKAPSNNPVPVEVSVPEAEVVEDSDEMGGHPACEGEWEVPPAHLTDPCKHDDYALGTQYMEETSAGYCNKGNNMFGVS